MTRKPTTKSPEERKLRAEIRALLQVHLADHSRNNTDHVVRELLNLIDDEVRRTRMSFAPVVQYDEEVEIKKAVGRAAHEGKFPMVLTCGGK